MSKIKINRRNFISALGLGTAHLMFSNPLYADTSKRLSADPFQKVKLGNSGIETSLLGMGTGVHATEPVFLHGKITTRALNFWNMPMTRGFDTLIWQTRTELTKYWRKP